MSRLNRHHIQRLAAYIPATLIEHIAANKPLAVGQFWSANAATMFADISGFTPMSEQLAQYGDLGIEELNRSLKTLFEPMIAEIHRLGGTIGHLYGDGMLVYFPDDVDGFPATQRALHCAKHLQEIMAHRFGTIKVVLPEAVLPFAMSMKVGLGYGACVKSIVGSRSIGMEFVLAGAGVEDATSAEKQANRGDIICSDAFLQQLLTLSRADVALLDDPGHLADVSLPIVDDWQAYSPAVIDRLGRWVGLFVPRELTQRLVGDMPPVIGEHRPVTSIFVEFDGLDVEDADFGRKLNTYYLWAWQIVRRYLPNNGRVNRILSGDKGYQLHIIVGAPTAPQAPAQAMRCVLALQRSRSRPEFIKSQRIGVATGQVFASAFGAGQRVEYTIVGSIVNLSARLASQCKPEQILTDPTTAGMVRHALEFKQLPPQLLKGLGQVALLEPIKEKINPADFAARFGEEASNRPLIGRQTQLDQLRERLHHTARGNVTLTVLRGAAGAGKTRLVGAGAEAWMQVGGRGFVGSCTQHRSETPFSPLLPIWRAMFHLRNDQNSAEQRTQIEQAVSTIGVEQLEDIPLWLELFGFHTETPITLQAEERQARLFDLIRNYLQRLSSDQPLLFVLEDVHWADQSTCDLIGHLLKAVNNLPIGLIITVRDDEQVTLPLIVSHPRAETIYLPDLTPAETRTYLQQLLDQRHLPVGLEEHFGIHQQADYITHITPLFLEQSIRAMLDAGVLYQHDRLYLLDQTKLQRLSLPVDVKGLLLARLDSLPYQQKRVVQRAAVIGDQFDRATLKAVSPFLSGKGLDRALVGLVSAEIIQLLTTDPHPTYLFHHGMTRTAAYEALPFDERKQFHAATAHALEQYFADNLDPHLATLAFHFDLAQMPSEAFDYASRAASNAYTIFANREAIQLYNLALAHKPEEISLDLLFDIYHSLGSAYIWSGEFEYAETHFQTLLTRLQGQGELAKVGEVYVKLAEISARQFHYETTLAHAQYVINTFSDQMPLDRLAQAHIWYAHSAINFEQYDIALEQLAIAKSLCEQIEHTRSLSFVMETIAYVHYMRFDLEECAIALQRSLRLLRQNVTPHLLATSINNLALVQRMNCDYKAALASCDEALALAMGTSPNLYASVLSQKAVMLTCLGRLEEASLLFEDAHNRLETMRDKQSLVELFLLWGYEYACGIEDWKLADYCFGRVEAIIEAEPFEHVKDHVRLLLGKACVLINHKQFELGKQALTHARRLTEAHNLTWLQSALEHYQARLLMRECETLPCHATDAIVGHLQMGLQAVHNKGCPEYHTGLLISLAQVTENNVQRFVYLEQSLPTFAYARYCEKQKWLNQAMWLLEGSPHRQRDILLQQFRIKARQVPRI